MNLTNKQLVTNAKREWIKRMKKTYPEFNHNLWERSNSYRMAHPQQAF